MFLRLGTHEVWVIEFDVEERYGATAWFVVGEI